MATNMEIAVENWGKTFWQFSLFGTKPTNISRNGPTKMAHDFQNRWHNRGKRVAGENVHSPVPKFVFFGTCHPENKHIKQVDPGSLGSSITYSQVTRYFGVR